MATRDQLKALAKTRLKEAEALFAAGLYDGAAYLSGYVVELALKARICRILAIRDYPDTGKYKQVYATHDFDQLLFLAGLRSKMQPNSSLFLKWSIASTWTPERRYSPVGTFTKQDAEDVLNAIRDPTDGILRWIKKHW
jgi:HEPN domain-containing protein